MPVDNDLYDRMSDTWWDDAGCLNILQSALNPVRVPFLERRLRTRFAALQGLLVIKIFQEWRATAFMPPNLHEHAAFVTPAELAALLRSSGLEPGSIVGIGPGVTPPRAIALMRARARGRLTYGEFGRALRMRE